jgi:hypothetical protein
MKSVSCSQPGYASITCSTISNIPYNLIFITKFNDTSILITIISWNYLNLSVANEYVGDVRIPNQVIKYNHIFCRRISQSDCNDMYNHNAETKDKIDFIFIITKVILLEICMQFRWFNSVIFVICKLHSFSIKLSEWASDCCLTPKSAIFQLYHHENKLYLGIIMSAFY